MPKYMTQYNAEDLLKYLSQENCIKEEQFYKFIACKNFEKEMPIYLRIIISIGAFITSLCLLTFLIMADIISFKNHQDLIIIGMVFTICAILLQNLSKNTNNIKHSFLSQSSFTFIAAGKILFVMGVANISNSPWGVTLGLFVITSLTYNIYRMSIDRFLSTCAVIFSIFANILFSLGAGISKELLLYGFFILQFIIAAILLTNNKITHDYIPISYAFIFSICSYILLSISYEKFGYLKKTPFIDPIFLQITLTISLILLVTWIVGDIQKLKTQQFIAGMIGIIILGIFSSAGILIAIGLMVIGYAKHERLLLYTGYIFMPIFLFLYYYHLDISLIQKSGVLIASGVILLAGRFYLSNQFLNKGEL